MKTKRKCCTHPQHILENVPKVCSSVTAFSVRSVWLLFSLYASLVFEQLDHNKRLLMTEAVGLSGGNHYAHIWSHKTSKRPGDEERKRECQQTDWKCSYNQQISLSDVTAFPLTSFLALGRSMRIFKARRSWFDFFTQTLNREKRGVKRTQSTQQPVRPWSRC